eukprot:Gb_03043 [translate_table: standard]
MLGGEVNIQTSNNVVCDGVAYGDPTPLVYGWEAVRCVGRNRGVAGGTTGHPQLYIFQGFSNDLLCSLLIDGSKTNALSLYESGRLTIIYLTRIYVSPTIQGCVVSPKEASDKSLSLEFGSQSPIRVPPNVLNGVSPCAP